MYQVLSQVPAPLPEMAGGDVMASLEKRLARAKEMLDPLGRALALERLLADVDAFREDVVNQRAIAIYEANNASVPLAQLAQSLGKSKTLMQQQVALGRHLAGDDD